MKRKRNPQGTAPADGSKQDMLSAPMSAPSSKSFYLIAAVLIVLTGSVYGQVRHHEFFDIDDGEYITLNPHVKNGLTRDGLIWSFTTQGYASAWHPLTWISHMIDCDLYGLNPSGHHLTNVAFHLANVFILFLVLTKMTGSLWPSAFVAALFALHPLNVESVAWAAERKNVLSTLFWLLTMWAYARYAQRPAAMRQLLVCVFLALGLLSKPMLVTVPLVLLLLDVWPLKRLKDSSSLAPLVVEKLPLFGLVAVSILFTLLVEHKGAGVSIERLPVEYRIANAFLSYLKYLLFMIWPAKLAYFYPHPGMDLSVRQGVAAATAVALVTILALRAVRTKPYLTVGWLWYLVTLVPVIGLVQVGRQSMADRYAYVPLIGICIVIAWGVSDLMANVKQKKYILSACASVVIVALAIATNVQVGHWRSSIAMYEHALNVNPSNFQAHYNLATGLFEKGNLNQAIYHFSETIRLKPHYYPLAYLNTGTAYARKGMYDQAIPYFEETLKIQPNNWLAHKNIGFCYIQKGNFDAALEHYSKALEIDPNQADIHLKIGYILARQGKLEEAIARFSESLRLNPNLPDARRFLEEARRMLNR